MEGSKTAEGRQIDDPPKAVGTKPVTLETAANALVDIFIKECKTQDKRIANLEADIKKVKIHIGMKLFNFPDLPAELRSKIWDQALSVPRIIPLCLLNAAALGGLRLKACSGSSGRMGARHACRDSLARSDSLQNVSYSVTYEHLRDNETSTRSHPIVDIPWMKDEVYQYSPFNSLYPLNSSMAFELLYNAGCRAGVLALDEHLWYKYTTHNGRKFLDTLSKIGVKELVLVVGRITFRNEHKRCCSQEIRDQSREYSLEWFFSPPMQPPCPRVGPSFANLDTQPGELDSHYSKLRYSEKQVATYLKERKLTWQALEEDGLASIARLADLRTQEIKDASEEMDNGNLEEVGEVCELKDPAKWTVKKVHIREAHTRGGFNQLKRLMSVDRVCCIQRANHSFTVGKNRHTDSCVMSL